MPVPIALPWRADAHRTRTRIRRRAALLALAGFGLLMAPAARAVDAAPYQVVQQYPNFELRRYSPGLVAETTVTGDFDGVGNKAFTTLADYIGGKNRSGAKIAMTAPVIQAPATEPGAADSYLFAFVMPSTYTAATLPPPTDPQIRVREVAARLMAAHRYSGVWSQTRYRQAEAILLDAVRAAGLNTVGVPVFARYNPPFMPWFLRRNEVLIEVEDPAEATRH